MTATTCLSIDRALAFVGDMHGVMTLLRTLKQSLPGDLSQLQALLDAGDLPGSHRLLHQLKGFAPVLCMDTLVAQVIHAESLSKGNELLATRTAYAHLAPQLQQLLTEVQDWLDQAA